MRNKRELTLVIFDRPLLTLSLSDSTERSGSRTPRSRSPLLARNSKTVNGPGSFRDRPPLATCGDSSPCRVRDVIEAHGVAL